MKKIISILLLCVCIIIISCPSDTSSSSSSSSSGSGDGTNNPSSGNGDDTNNPTMYDIFVAVGANGTIMRSTNGTTWTSVTSNTSKVLYDVAYLENKFYVVGADGTMLQSNDGTAWTSITSGTTANLLDITHISSLNIYVTAGGSETTGGNSVVLVSSDGTTWTKYSSGTTAEFNDINYAFGWIRAIGHNAAIFRSQNNGVNWAQIHYQANNADPFYDSVLGGSRLVIVGGSGTIWYIDAANVGTGEAWQKPTTNASTQIRAVTHAENRFVAVGRNTHKILYSADGATWTKVTNFDSNADINLLAITYGNSKFLAVGEKGSVVSSDDGITWKSETAITNIALYGVTYARK